MKIKKSKSLAMFTVVTLVLVLIFTMASSAFADGELGTQRDYVVSLMKTAGLPDSVIGTTDSDKDLLAKSLGFFDNWTYDSAVAVTPEIAASMDAAMANAYNGLRNALNKNPMEPYFVHGMAQPIFPYGDSDTMDTTGTGLARFLVYVETENDTDNDGKLDLIAVFVQLPRACVTQGMKAGTIFHGQPYNEGTNDGTGYSVAQRTDGNNWLNANGSFTHERLYRESPIQPRVTSGYATTQQMVANADPLDWKYTYTSRVSGANLYADVTPRVLTGNQISSTTAHNYFAVRGFALVSTAGIGTYLGDGLSTYGTDVEIAAYKSVVDWLNGNARAFTNKTDNIEIKADWSNGYVGMTGTSYGGTIPVGVASTGVKGLEAIVPVCGIASYYEYQNQQGAVNWRAQYTPGMSKYVSNNYGKPTFKEAGDPLRGRQLGYTQQMFTEALALNGTYGEHWERRDYTLDGWSKDWGPSKLKAPMLIIEGLNDNNVRPKQGVLMKEMTRKAGVPGKMIWMQGAHTTPNNQMIGEYAYQEWLNLWFSHYLFKVDNNVLEMLPEVYAQSNITGDYEAYDSWESDHKLILDNDNRVKAASSFGRSAQPIYEDPVENTQDYYIVGGEGNGEPGVIHVETDEISDASASMAISAADAEAEDGFVTLNSANGTGTWTNLLDAPTAGGTLYSFVLPEDVTVKGVVAVNFRAAVETLGSNFYEGRINTTTEAPPQAKIHAKLVEVAAPGTTVTAFGANSVGTGPSSQTVVSRGLYVGGGLSSSNITRYVSSTFQYRELARGQMSLAHPGSGYDSVTSGAGSYIDLTQNIGVFHDYTLYLQPTVHTAKKGNRLVLILTIGHPTSDGIVTGAATGANAFTFTVDTNASNVVIPLAEPMGNLKLTTDAESLKAGEYFHVTPSFVEPVKSNVAVLNFIYDKDKFQYSSFPATPGVTLLNSEETSQGVRLTVMVSGYNTTTYGDILFSAKEDADLGEGENAISVVIDYVVLLEDNVTKDVVREKASTTFTTIPDYPPPTEINLLTLSNLIDVFGMTKANPEWPKWAYYDFNRNYRIDIQDIATIARELV